jgi:hypothetical protein
MWWVLNVIPKSFSRLKEMYLVSCFIVLQNKCLNTFRVVTFDHFEV